MRWSKGEKWIIISIFISTIIVSQIIYILEESKKPGKAQIEASDIRLDYYLDEDTDIISLYLVNKSQKAAYGVNITIDIPGIKIDTHLKRTFTIAKTGNCKVSKKNNNTLTIDFSNETIYPTFSNKRAYPVLDFKFNSVTKNVLKETNQAIEYVIASDEDEFIGRIPVFYIFTFKKIQ
jgi:hypothetical protein